MKKACLIFCIFYILHAPFSILHGNSLVDSLQTKKHSPKTASWLALIPGAGQIYNKKYWKLPIVYGGLGATGYLIYHFQHETSVYRKEIVARLKNDTINFNPKFSDKQIEDLRGPRDVSRRNMEICVAASAIVYALSILDACVDAHLFYYDISENLTMGIRPKINYNPISRTATPNLSLVLKF